MAVRFAETVARVSGVEARTPMLTDARVAVTAIGAARRATDFFLVSLLGFVLLLGRALASRLWRGSATALILCYC